jgi:hypothetical protein
MGFGFNYGFNYGLPLDPQRAIIPDGPNDYNVSLSSETGWAGDSITLLAPGLYSGTRDDDFHSLDHTNQLWLSYTNNDYNVEVKQSALWLTAGPDLLSIAGIRSKKLFYSSDSTVQFVIYPNQSGVPTSLIDYVVFEARMTDNRYIKVIRSWDVAYGHIYRSIIVYDDITIPHRAIRANSNIGELRIIYNSDSITIFVRDLGQSWSVLAYHRLWPTDFKAYLYIYTTNNNASALSACKIRSFISKPGVLFGKEPSVDTIPSINDLVTIVPNQRTYKTHHVDVSLFDYTGNLGTLSNAFDYVRPKPRILMSNHTTLITTSLVQDKLDIYGEVIGIYNENITGIGDIGSSEIVNNEPVKLLFINNPSSGLYSTNRLPIITIISANADNQLAPISGVTITLELYTTSHTEAILAGTLTKTISGGISRFNDLFIMGVNSASYTNISLKASISGLEDAISTTFTVFAGKIFLNKIHAAPPYRHLLPL